MTYVPAEARQELIDSVAEAARICQRRSPPSARPTRHSTTTAPTGSRRRSSGRCSCASAGDPDGVGLRRARRTARAGDPRGPRRPAVPRRQGLLEDAAESVRLAEAILTELQDSLSPVEVGDAELRAGLADVRERMAPPRARRSVHQPLRPLILAPRLRRHRGDVGPRAAAVGGDVLAPTLPGPPAGRRSRTSTGMGAGCRTGPRHGRQLAGRVGGAEAGRARPRPLRRRVRAGGRRCRRVDA